MTGLPMAGLCFLIGTNNGWNTIDYGMTAVTMILTIGIITWVLSVLAEMEFELSFEQESCMLWSGRYRALNHELHNVREERDETEKDNTRMYGEMSKLTQSHMDLRDAFRQLNENHKTVRNEAMCLKDRVKSMEAQLVAKEVVVRKLKSDLSDHYRIVKQLNEDKEAALEVIERMDQKLQAQEHPAYPVIIKALLDGNIKHKDLETWKAALGAA